MFSFHALPQNENQVDRANLEHTLLVLNPFFLCSSLLYVPQVVPALPV
jgi:hypothetical protein